MISEIFQRMDSQYAWNYPATQTGVGGIQRRPSRQGIEYADNHVKLRRLCQRRNALAEQPVQHRLLGGTWLIRLCRNPRRTRADSFRHIFQRLSRQRIALVLRDGRTRVISFAG